MKFWTVILCVQSDRFALIASLEVFKGLLVDSNGEMLWKDPLLFVCRICGVYCRNLVTLVMAKIKDTWMAMVSLDLYFFIYFCVNISINFEKQNPVP